MTPTRKLAAIMFTDIVGYTALMGKDEKLAFQVLHDNRQLQKPLIASHGGTYIKELGDGTLASFSTVVDAVNCACLMIKGAEAINGLDLRIGIHLGDVIFQDGDVFGDSVNIAARLQSLAPINTIWISESVQKNLTNKQGIISTYVREEKLKNVEEPVQIFEVDINSFHEAPVVHTSNPLSQKSNVATDKRKPGFKKLLLWSIPIFVLAACGFLFIPNFLKKQKARTEIIPTIEQLVESNFRPPVEAFLLATEAQKYIPNDSALIKLWPFVATRLTFDTEPSGAEVYWKDYTNHDDPWRLIGTTPLNDVRIPMTFIRMEIRKENFKTLTYADRLTRNKATLPFSPLKLDSIGSYPDEMVRIPSGTTIMSIVGLEKHGPKEVNSFFIDKNEVTNKAYKAFMDAGGYINKAFWKHEFFDGRNIITFEEASAKFKDPTGQTGPSTWEAGSYPNGKEDHPVTGISWYEASAYAVYADKQLPTVFHWSLVAATSQTEFIASLSNLASTGTVPVGTLPGYSTFGIYDMAGNAREWCVNDNGQNNKHYILGGGWSDPTYSFNDSYMQSAFNRDKSNGLRCMKLLPGDTSFVALSAPLKADFRDYTQEKPVDDLTFAQIESQFTYDKTDLKSKIEQTFDREFWTVEKISFDAAYGNERMEAYLYIPKGFTAPYQPIIFFPGSGDIFSTKYDPDRVDFALDFILKNGRAFVYPIYKGTHERHDALNSDLPETTVFYKDHVIMWVKDIGRTLDYLETRKDIQNDKVGFLGWSWGGYMGGIVPAIEKRIKAIVLNVGGMVMTPSLPASDQINFLPRITQPVLMLNGKHDMYFPVETSQKPMFNFLGTPADHKKMILYESGHLVPRTDFIKETLAWYDKYLDSPNNQKIKSSDSN